MAQFTMKALRVNAGMTQREVAKTIGVGVPTIIRWEKGETSPSLEKVVQLAALYKCNVEDFLMPYTHS